MSRLIEHINRGWLEKGDQAIREERTKEEQRRIILRNAPVGDKEKQDLLAKALELEMNPGKYARVMMQNRRKSEILAREEEEKAFT